MSDMGTAREIADRNILRFQRALDAIRFGGGANPLVVRQALDDWLEYRMRHMEAGTLDEPRSL